jgi:hypothetical protein
MKSDAEEMIEDLLNVVVAEEWFETREDAANVVLEVLRSGTGDVTGVDLLRLVAKRIGLSIDHLLPQVH